MTDLSPKARALLARTATGLDPRATDRDRVRGVLYARIGAAAAAGGATALAGGATANAAGRHVVRSALTKLGLGTTMGKALGVAIVVGATAMTFKLTRPSDAPDVRTTAPAPVHAAAAPLAPAPLAAATPREEPRIVPLVDVASLPAAEPKTNRTAPASVAKVEPDSLESEMQLLRDAQAASREHDDARALAWLDAHAERYPRGVLAEERAAARIFALCNVGRIDEGQKARAAFLAAHPSSPHNPRVRAACGGE